MFIMATDNYRPNYRANYGTRQPATWSASARVLISSLLRAYVANEHKCAPPSHPDDWQQVAHTRGEPGRAIYLCAECGQLWRRQNS